MQNQQIKANKRTRLWVMIALIIIPFLLAAFLWWILPSGHRAQFAQEDGIGCQTNLWHPLQPAIKLGAGIFKP
jgi:hypothetical protein